VQHIFYISVVSMCVVWCGVVWCGVVWCVPPTTGHHSAMIHWIVHGRLGDRGTVGVKDKIDGQRGRERARESERENSM
jgi:hypothetical protein